MSSRSRRLTMAAVPLGILASGVLVWQSSYAAFTSTTQNSGNSFSAGTVTVSGAPTTALFSPTGLKPGSSDVKCVVVRNGGTLDAAVHLYATGLSSTSAGSVAPYLTLQVAEGSGSSSTCGDFSKTTDLFNAAGGTSGSGTSLADFAGSSTHFATGVGESAAIPASGSRTFRITYQLRDTNDAQGKDASVGFTWEAQNT